MVAATSIVRIVPGVPGRAIYEAVTIPEGFDLTGEDLIQRVDDEEATVRNRLAVYKSQTRPLVDYYSQWAASGDAHAPKYRRIEGVGTVEDITQRALAALA